MIYDVAIIGAGPCGLAAAARLREKTPSALYTNDEHARYWKRHNQQSNSLEQEYRRRKTSTDSGYASEDDGSQQSSMIVLDAKSDQWMATWNERFDNLNITQLRSPLFFHPDPQDRDGLLAFAHEQDRVDELCEIPNVVGKELSKHEKKRERSRRQARTTARHLRIDGRDQVDYYTPSTALFRDYCQSIIKRYHLDNVVHQAKVIDISYSGAGQDDGLFTLTCENEIIFARIMVIATGPSRAPYVPGIERLSAPSRSGSICHVFAAGGASIPVHVKHKITQNPSKQIDILVVGGGLTSAQICHEFLSFHRSIRVHLLLRHSKMKCKPFDVDLPWVSKTRNHLMSAYWSAETDEERLTMLKQARNGGSVNPPFKKIIDGYIAEGRLTVHTNTVLKLNDDCVWNTTKELWTDLDISPPPTVSSKSCFPFPSGIDHIVYATGSAPDFASIGYLESLRQKYTFQTMGGLPIANVDLMLHDDLPCFVTGALASLRLGPGAANLAGARAGAERVAWKVEETLGRNKTRKQGSFPRDEFTGSFQNQFSALSMD